MRRGEHDIHERLKELVTEVRKWTAFGGGVKVMTREDIQPQQEEFLARAEERERAREAAARDEPEREAEEGDSPAGAGGSGEAPEAHSPQ